MAIVNETLWITGAGSGIGKAVTELLARGNTIFISGRKQDPLEQLAGRFPDIHVIPFDVTSCDDALAAAARISRNSDHIDRLILCAGDCQYFEIQEQNWHIMKEIMAVNYHGMVHCLEAALPLLNKAEKPHITGITSLAVLAPFPKASAYGASKAAASYLLDSMRIDLAAQRIDITEIRPGFIDTPLTRQNDFDMPFIMSPEKAAEKLYMR